MCVIETNINFANVAIVNLNFVWLGIGISFTQVTTPIGSFRSRKRVHPGLQLCIAESVIIKIELYLQV